MQAASSRRRHSEGAANRGTGHFRPTWRAHSVTSCGLIFHRLPAAVVGGFVQPASIRGPREAAAVGALLWVAPG